MRDVISNSGASPHNEARTGGMLPASVDNRFGKGNKMTSSQEFLPGSHHLLRISEYEQMAYL